MEQSNQKEEKETVVEGQSSKTIANKIITTVLLIIGVALIAFSGYKLWGIFMDYHEAEAEYSELADKYGKKPAVGMEKEDKDTQAEISWDEMFSVDFEGLRRENKEVAGWIFFENEEISYPVMYSGDNDKYLRTTLDGSNLQSGSIFIEGNNNPTFEDANTLIYGHNMKNLSMFGRLRYYREDDAYYKDHSYFQILVDGKKYRYQIFAYETVHEASELIQMYIQHNENYERYLEQVKKRSSIHPDIEVGRDDTVITLSTCSSGDTDGEYRFLVHAKRVDEKQANER